MQSQKYALTTAINCLNLKNDNTSYTKLNPIIPFHDSIAFHNVSFKYDDSSNLTISNLNIRIIQGKVTGIVGKSGIGKTTILDLIMGLLSPTCGEILVDDVKINNNNLAAWQEKISHVPQNIYLLDSSIIENIAFGLDIDLIDINRVREVVQISQLEDVIANLPEGYSTNIGERGIRLSGGQKQRLGIARALYKKTPIIILDEATSALDSKTQSLIIESLKNYNLDKDVGEKTTLIIVSHDMKMFDHCDEIINLDIIYK